MQGAGVHHGGQDAVDLQAAVETVLDPLDGLNQKGHPPQREELGLQGDDDAMGGGQSIDGE